MFERRRVSTPRAVTALSRRLIRAAPGGVQHDKLGAIPSRNALTHTELIQMRAMRLDEEATGRMKQKHSQVPHPEGKSQTWSACLRPQARFKVSLVKREVSPLRGWGV